MWLGYLNPRITTWGTELMSDEPSDKNYKTRDRIRTMGNFKQTVGSVELPFLKRT
jgi:hypothetical protein